MSNFSNARSGRIYCATQTSFAAAAALTGANCCRHTSIRMAPTNPRSPRNDKTGTLSRTPGIGGYRQGTFSCTMDLAANGSAGVAPDCDPFLQSIFGAAPTIVASTSVTYALADTFIPITVGHYRTPSTMRQQIGWGIALSEAEWGFNDGVVAKWKMSGSGVYVPDSQTFSTLASQYSGYANGGMLIAAFTEPTSPVTNGGVVTSFIGLLTVDSTVVATVKSGMLTFRKPVSPQNAFGTPYVTGWGLGVRDVSLKFDLFDDDSAMMTDLMQHGIEDNVVGATLVLGNVAGNTWTWNMVGVQLVPPGLDDSSGDRWVAQFADQSATASSVALTNELNLVIT